MAASDLPVAVEQAVRAAIQAPLSEAGYWLEEVTVAPAGKRLVVRVLLDAAEINAASLSLDQIALASQQISQLLDNDAAFNQLLGQRAYLLECSTAGVGRPLTQLRHWQRAVGRLVQVDLTDGGSMQGRISSVQPESGVNLQLEKPPKGKGKAASSCTSPQLDWEQIRQARVQVEFRSISESGQTSENEEPVLDELDANAPDLEGTQRDTSGTVDSGQDEAGSAVGLTLVDAQARKNEEGN